MDNNDPPPTAAWYLTMKSPIARSLLLQKAFETTNPLVARIYVAGGGQDLKDRFGTTSQQRTTTNELCFAPPLVFPQRCINQVLDVRSVISEYAKVAKQRA